MTIDTERTFEVLFAAAELPSLIRTQRRFPVLVFGLADEVQQRLAGRLVTRPS